MWLEFLVRKSVNKSTKNQHSPKWLKILNFIPPKTNLIKNKTFRWKNHLRIFLQKEESLSPQRSIHPLLKRIKFTQFSTLASPSKKSSRISRIQSNTPWTDIHSSLPPDEIKLSFPLPSQNPRGQRKERIYGSTGRPPVAALSISLIDREGPRPPWPGTRVSSLDAAAVSRCPISSSRRRDSREKTVQGGRG